MQESMSIYLKRELARRCESNESYSLRSFARFLDVDSSRLSKILKGQRPVNNQLVDSFGEKLNLSIQEIESFKLQKRISQKQKKQIQKEQNYRPVSFDMFELISDWQHYAILELLKFNSFVTDEKWIASQLNLSVYQVRDSVERLIRVGILKVTDEGKWIDLSEGFSTHALDNNKTTYAHKKYQKDVLTKATEALEKSDPIYRDNSSMMMATNKKKIEQAKLMIKQFRRELCDFLEDTDEYDSIYQMGIALYPLNEISEK